MVCGVRFGERFVRWGVFLQDTFRGRVCECPLVSGVQFEGDGYTHCEGEAAMMYGCGILRR